MPNDSVISVESLSKRYRLGHQRQANSLGDRITSGLKGAARWFIPGSEPKEVFE